MNCVIYARFSSHNQREESIEGQIRLCTEYANKNNWTIVGVYIDRALTGRESVKRKDFNKMIRDSAHKQFEFILVYKLDRFARNKYESAMFKHKLKQSNVRVVSATEYIPDTPEGMMMETMLEGMAQYYSENLSQNIRRGITENNINGKSNGGNILLGYKTVNQIIVVDPEKAEIVRHIFNMYNGGLSSEDIAKYLKIRNIRTNQGNFYKIQSLVRIFSNKKYIGFKNESLRIIDDETFEKAQARIEKTKRAPARGKADVEYLLTGKLFCGKCGTGMVGDSGTGKMDKTYYYYACSKKKKQRECDRKNLIKEKIEALVIKQATRVLYDDEYLNTIADKLMEAQAEEKKDAPLKALELELKENQKSINNILDAIEKGMFHVSMKARLDALELSAEELRSAIAREKVNVPVYTKTMVLEWLKHFRKGDKESMELNKKLIDVFINAVYVYDDDIAFVFNYYQNTEKITLTELNQTLEGFGLVNDGGACAVKSELFCNRNVFGYLVRL